MGTEWAIWLARDDGTRIASLDQAVSFEYVRTVNQPGRFTVDLPGDFDLTLLDKDRRVAFWRRPVGGEQRLDFDGLITWIGIADDAHANPIITIAGPSLSGLLERRIVAYAAASAQASKTAEADDLMRAIIRENFGADATDTARSLDASLFSVQPDLTLGPALTKGFAWRKTSDVLAELADAARQAGTEVFYEFAPIDDTTLEFRVAIDQPGLDRTADVILRRGQHLANCSVTLDYDSERNVIYAGGQGTEAARVIKSSEDTARSGLSIFARSEDFTNASANALDDGVQAAADAALIAARPALKISAEILQVPGAIYGLDFFFGDRVTADLFGLQRACLIRSVHVSVSSGKEMVEARLETG